MSSRFSVDIDRLEQVATQLTGLAGYLEDQLDGSTAGSPRFWRIAGAA